MGANGLYWRRKGLEALLLNLPPMFISIQKAEI
jgi:hypothetical protein